MLGYLIAKEWKQLRRNRFLPRMIVLFPILVLLIFPHTADFEVKEIRLAVVDQDLSQGSQRLINKICASDYFRLAARSESYRRALSLLETGKADALIEIPKDFALQLHQPGKAELFLAADAVNGSKGSIAISYLSQIIQEFSAEGSRQSMMEILPRYHFNPELHYPVFMLPALMVMLLTMICGFLPALNIVSEKERGTLEQLNVTPVGRFPFILSKLIPYWLIGYLVLSICIIVARLMYALSPQGSLASLFLFSTIYTLGISGFGLIISNYAKSLQQAMFMMFFAIISFIFLSGLYTPIESMSPWARRLSFAIPLRYMIEALRRIYLKGSGLSDLLPQLGALCAFAILFNGWAVYSYKKTDK